MKNNNLLINELGTGDGTYYLAQEAAFAPGIAGTWPDVIPHPINKNGRLVKRTWDRRHSQYLVTPELMGTLWDALVFYSNLASYEAPRTGGVLAGCPRGEKPTPQELALVAQSALTAIRREIPDEPKFPSHLQPTTPPPVQSASPTAKAPSKVVPVIGQECLHRRHGLGRVIEYDPNAWGDGGVEVRFYGKRGEDGCMYSVSNFRFIPIPGIS